MSKSVSKFLNEYLEDSLEEILSILRVNPDLSSVIRAYDKCFSCNCNYAKGDGEEFLQFIMTTTATSISTVSLDPQAADRISFAWDQ